MKKQNAENSQRARGWWNCAADGTAYPFGAGTVKSAKDSFGECNPPRPAALRRKAQCENRIDA